MKLNDKPTGAWACPNCFGRVRVETLPGHAIAYPDGSVNEEEHDIAFGDDGEAECLK